MVTDAARRRWFRQRKRLEPQNVGSNTCDVSQSESWAMDTVGAAIIVIHADGRMESVAACSSGIRQLDDRYGETAHAFQEEFH